MRGARRFVRRLGRSEVVSRLVGEGSLAFKMIASQFYLNGAAKQAQLVKAFGINPLALKRWVKRALEGALPKPKPSIPAPNCA